MNRAGRNVIMGPWIVIMGPCKVNRETLNVKT